jgi:hypothetical protein
MPFRKRVANGKGKYSYGFDLKEVFEWNCERGYANGVAVAEKKAAKTKGGAAAGSVYVDPETGEKIEITGPEVLRAINRTILAKADTAEENALKARLQREQEQKIVSYNDDITPVFAYTMRQTAAAIASAEDGVVKLLIERGVHPDEARREVNGRIRQMLEPLDKAKPFVDPLAAERAAAILEEEAEAVDAEIASEDLADELA